MQHEVIGRGMEVHIRCDAARCSTQALPAGENQIPCNTYFRVEFWRDSDGLEFEEQGRTFFPNCTAPVDLQQGDVCAYCGHYSGAGSQRLENSPYFTA